VVNYTVVVDVANPEGSLLPGMTATVDFVTATATGVFKVSNSALRFRPTAEMIDELRNSHAASEQREGSARPNMAGSSGGPNSFRNGTAPSNFKRLFYLDSDGRLAAIPVHTGVSDGTSTQIDGPGLEEGMEIIASVTQSAQKASSNPFSGQQQQPRPGPPGPGF